MFLFKSRAEDKKQTLPQVCQRTCALTLWNPRVPKKWSLCLTDVIYNTDNSPGTDPSAINVNN